ncbi:MAG: molybdopterin-binding oxidoreductase, partial [Nitrospirota bacterium]|nr:molybdopterin-binding oxidoreductase [Nitrospirota bacterium]
SNGSIMMEGFAFSGTRGIRSVEISVDGGDTWQLTQLKPALSPNSWIFWNYSWQDPKPGYYRLLVRATDGTGTLQSALDQKPFPDGGTGLQEIWITVTG